MTTKSKFDDYGFEGAIIATLHKKGFVSPTEIQEKAIPVILKRDSDVIGIASTGTGKTAAFGLPILHMVSSGNREPRAVILAPTRELALQITKDLESFREPKRHKIVTVYGGQPIMGQIRELKYGADIIVGTPGRVHDLIRRDVLHMHEVQYCVLDEADEMLKMGFMDDMDVILGKMPKSRKTYLFSATVPPKIRELAKKYMKEQVIVEVKKVEEANPLITQIFYKINDMDKVFALRKILAQEEGFYGIVFCTTRRETEMLTRKLRGLKHNIGFINGDFSQNKREKTLREFREMRINVLVATDVAARGIDVTNLTHVVNYSLPREKEVYVHRIGRTGRAGKSGTAVSFVSGKDIYKVRDFERLTHQKIDIQNLELTAEDKVEPPRKDQIDTREERGDHHGHREHRREGNFSRENRGFRRENQFGGKKSFGSSRSFDRPKDKRHPNREGDADGERTFDAHREKRREDHMKKFGKGNPTKKWGGKNRSEFGADKEHKPKSEFSSNSDRREGGFSRKFHKGSSNKDWKEKKSFGDKKPFGEKREGSFGGKRFGDKKFGNKKFGDKKGGFAGKRKGGGKWVGDKEAGNFKRDSGRKKFTTKRRGY